MASSLETNHRKSPIDVGISGFTRSEEEPFTLEVELAFSTADTRSKFSPHVHVSVGGGMCPCAGPGGS